MEKRGGKFMKNECGRTQKKKYWLRDANVKLYNNHGMVSITKIFTILRLKNGEH